MRLSTRISLLIISVAIALALINSWLLGARLSDHLSQEQDRLIRILTRGIGETTAREVLANNVLATHDTLKNIVAVSPELQYAYIIGFDGKLFADSFDDGFPTALLGLRHTQEGQLKRADFRTDNELISDVAYPLIEGLDAELHLGYSQSHNLQVTNKARRDLALSAAAIAILAVLVALWFGRRLSQPLEGLRHQMQAYGAGTLDQPHPIDTMDHDVQDLLQAFSTMVSERKALDGQLQDSERYNRMLFETSPIGLALTRMDGRLVDINAAFANIIGRSIKETLPLSYWDITPKDYAEQESQQLKLLRKHGRYGPYEKEYLHKDGHRVPVRLSGRTIIRSGEEFIWSAVEDISAVVAATEQQRMLATILEATPDFAGTAGLDGRAVYINRGGRRMLGIGDDDDLSNCSIAKTHPDWAYKIVAEQGIPAALRDGMWRGESALVNAEGKEIPVNIVIVPHYDSAGQPIFMSAVMSDISALKDKEQELLAHRQHLEELVAQRTEEVRQQARIIDQTHDAVITTDLKGIVSSWNNGAERLFGLPPEKVLGQHIAIVYPEQDHVALERQVTAPLLEKGSHETELRMQHADGRIFDSHLSLSLLYDDSHQPTGMVAYALDITERKRTQQELLTLAANLRQANQELESFTYSVSHDLRSPLRALDGFSQALLEDYGEQLDATAHDYLGRVRSAAQQMGRLIDDLLQLSRVSRSPIERQPVDLSALAHEIMQQLQATDPQRKAQIKIDDGLRTEGDPGLLRVVMDNLLGNAWKYTAKRDLAKIEFTSQTDAGAPAFLVHDNGAGFNMAYADKLFGVFQRLHHADEFPGTGVGLATVERIIRRHEGRIRADSEVGKGASFYFTLSHGQEPAPSEQETSTTRPDEERHGHGQ